MSSVGEAAFALLLSVLFSCPPSGPQTIVDDLPRVRIVYANEYGFADDFLADVDEALALTLLSVGIRMEGGVAADRRMPPSPEKRGVLSGKLAPESFLITLAASPPEAWNVKRTAMGMVVPGALPRRRILIFPTRVMRVLGQEREGSWPAKKGLPRSVARAFSRVIAHELVHALAPGLAHARRGLMRSRLNRSFLLAEDLPLDAASRDALESALARGRSG